MTPRRFEMKGARQGHIRSFSDNTNWVMDLGDDASSGAILMGHPASVFNEAILAQGASAYTPKYCPDMVLSTENDLGYAMRYNYLQSRGNPVTYYGPIQQAATHSTNNVTCEEINQMSPLVCAQMCPYAHSKSRSGNLEEYSGYARGEKGFLGPFVHNDTTAKPQKDEGFNAQLRLEASYTKQTLGRRACRHDLHKNTICSNCGTDRTSLWRRSSSGDPLCNACGLFKKLHGSSRPISLKTNIIRKRNRSRNASVVKRKPALRSEEGAHSKYFVVSNEEYAFNSPNSKNELLDSKARGKCANDVWYAPVKDWVYTPGNEIWNSKEYAYTQSHGSLSNDISTQHRRSLSGDLPAKPHIREVASTGNFSVY